MSVIELKGQILNEVAYIDDESFLKKLFELIRLRRQGEVAWPDDLPTEIIHELEIAALDDDESDCIPGEVAFQNFRQWARE